MNLLFVNRTAGLGGGTTYMRSLIPHLQAFGHQCDVMLRGGSALRELEGSVGETWWHPLVGRIATARIQDLIRRRKIDVVNPQTLHCARRCLPACQATGTSMVMTVHNIVDMSKHLDIADYASALVVMNEGNAAYLRATYHALADKVHVTHLPFARELYGDVAPPVTRTGSTPVEILYLGRLSHTKGKLGLQVAEAVAELNKAGQAARLTVCGTGSRLPEMRRLGRALKQRCGREVLRAPGGSRCPARFIGAADVVVGAGYSAIEGLGLGREVVGIGFEGLFGAVNAVNIDKAAAANFGDTGAKWKDPAVEDIVGELQAAISAIGTDRQWAKRYVEENLAAECVARDFADIVSEAIS